MQAKLEDEITAIQLEAELTARSLKTSVAVSKAEAYGTVIELRARRNGSPLCGAGTEPGTGLKTGQACQYGRYSSLRCPRCLCACQSAALLCGGTQTKDQEHCKMGPISSCIWPGLRGPHDDI